MIFDKDRRAAKRLAKAYGMPLSDVRQMLAIERGTTTGDIQETRSGDPAGRPSGHERYPFFGWAGLLLQALHLHPRR